MPTKKDYAVRRTTQEVAKAKEERARVKEQRKAEKAAKAAEAQRVAKQRQAFTGLKKHKRGPSTAGTPLMAIAWEPAGAWPSPLPTVVAEPIPVQIGPMPAYNPSALA
mmetsp:Transcript_40200/g.105824  ORF Transcript_40200/g.105824 Transcript_40200/m.105824 type:complete len:108 (+) Transcript_40200:280-603(+)